MDQRIEDYLVRKYANHIQYDCTFIRFVIGYRHDYTIKEYNQRLQATEEAFLQFLEFQRSSNLYNVLSLKQVNGVKMTDYLTGAFVYGANKYGHPLWWESGLKFRKNADMSIHEKLTKTQMNQVAAWFAKLLHEVKVELYSW